MIKTRAFAKKRLILEKVAIGSELERKFREIPGCFG
jgi:hypothetical protein